VFALPELQRCYRSAKLFGFLFQNAERMSLGDLKVVGDDFSRGHDMTLFIHEKAHWK
jgi:hypothetical protein